MARREEPPQFPNPVEIIPPSTNLLFSDKLYLQDSILYSCYRCINPGKQGRNERDTVISYSDGRTDKKTFSYIYNEE